MVQQLIEKLEAKQNLTQAEASALMKGLLSGAVGEDDIVTLLAAFNKKGATAEELTGLAEVMRAKAQETLEAAGVKVDSLGSGGGGELLDTCGTGGDGRGTFNVSTAAAVVAAGAGARVAKHGNRSISSRSGSADVLEALGVKLDLPLDRIPQCLEEVGLVFLFAPRLHLAMKHVQPARRRMKVKTVFNLLGPLTNPLGAKAQLLGVYETGLTEKIANVLGGLGSSRALVVSAPEGPKRGSGGLDEISTAGPTQVSELAGGQVETRNVEPEAFGLARARTEDFQGGDGKRNAEIMTGILSGEKSPMRDWVLANTSAALVAAGKAADFAQGTALAAEALDSGRARKTLEALVAFTRKHAG